MPAIKSISYYLRYPLMWVMLLWAITLPGQEVVVYSFLLHGIEDTATPLPASRQNGVGESDVKQRTVQAFLDANRSSFEISSLQLILKCLLLPVAFAHPADDVLRANAFDFISATLLAQLFPVSILPNAP